MFVGHYAVSLALKKVEKKASLGWLFLAVQFVDVLFFSFMMLGIERFNIVPNYTEFNHLHLEYMPYTHSLMASVAWSVLVYIIFRVLSGTHSVALAVALAVLSHWFVDLVVHTPDLPLWSDTSPKLGFGLWNHRIAAFAVETLFLLIGLWMYLGATKAASAIGKYGMIAFVALLIIINLGNMLAPAPAPAEKNVMAISAVVAYFVFAGIAWWLDGKRKAIGGR